MKALTLMLGCLLVLTSAASAELVALYKFDGNFNDTSGFGTAANATAVGDAKIVKDPQRGNVLAIRPNATSKEKPTGYVNCGHEKKFDFTTAMTLSFWLKRATFDEKLDNSWQRILTKGEATWRIQMASFNAWDHEIQSRAHLNKGYDFDRWTDDEVNGFKDNEWAHIVCVFGQGEKQMESRVYVNGKEALLEVSSDDSTQMVTHESDILIGEILEGLDPKHEAYGRPFRGFLDDVAFYNEALSEQQVQELYAKGLKCCKKEEAKDKKESKK